MPNVVLIMKSATGVQLLGVSNCLLVDHSVQRESSCQPTIMSGPKHATFEELTDEDEESCLQEELSTRALDGRGCSEFEAPGLAPLNPGSQSSSSQESPQPTLQCIGRIYWLLLGRGNSHQSKWWWRFWWCPVRLFGLWIETKLAVNEPDNLPSSHLKPSPEEPLLLMTVSRPSGELHMERDQVKRPMKQKILNGTQQSHWWGKWHLEHSAGRARLAYWRGWHLLKNVAVVCEWFGLADDLCLYLGLPKGHRMEDSMLKVTCS